MKFTKTAKMCIGAAAASAAMALSSQAVVIDPFLTDESGGKFEVINSGAANTMVFGHDEHADILGGQRDVEVFKGSGPNILGEVKLAIIDQPGTFGFLNYSSNQASGYARLVYDGNDVYSVINPQTTAIGTALGGASPYYDLTDGGQKQFVNLTLLSADDTTVNGAYLTLTVYSASGSSSKRIDILPTQVAQQLSVNFNEFTENITGTGGNAAMATAFSFEIGGATDIQLLFSGISSATPEPGSALFGAGLITVLGSTFCRRQRSGRISSPSIAA